MYIKTFEIIFKMKKGGLQTVFCSHIKILELCGSLPPQSGIMVHVNKIIILHFRLILLTNSIFEITENQF